MSAVTCVAFTQFLVKRLPDNDVNAMEVSGQVDGALGGVMNGPVT